MHVCERERNSEKIGGRERQSEGERERERGAGRNMARQQGARKAEGRIELKREIAWKEEVPVC